MLQAIEEAVKLYFRRPSQGRALVLMEPGRGEVILR